jgi:hydroxypyruvate isomerase
VRPRVAANISLLFAELPYLERPPAAVDAGFDAVETWWPFGAEPTPEDAEVDAFLRALDDAGAALVACNLYAGDMPAGERGVLSLPDRSTELGASIPVLEHIARETGCALFNALYGARDERFSPEEQDALALENIRAAADALPGTVLIEALAAGENGAYPLESPADVLRVVDASGRDNVRMLADVYHLARNGHDPLAALDLPAVAHVQVADAPGRHEPGTGELDFAAIFRRLESFDGWVGAEYRPAGATRDGLGWLEALR